jgi:phi13 family phage major tail protein
MVGTVNSTPIGVESLVVAIMDEVLGTYGAVTPVSPLINIKITPNSNTDILYADNIAVETVTTVGKIDVETEMQDLPLEVQALVLGHTLDASNGVMIYNDKDIAPYLALGFKIKKANGKYRYVWLLKGKFEELATEGKTQEEKVTFQTPKLKGTFVIRADGNWKFVMDEDSSTTPLTTFLDTVFVPVVV